MDWLFQCNPKLFDLAFFIESGTTSEGDWSMHQHREKISPEDRVFFWQTGKEARLLAIGHVTSSVYEREENSFGRYCVGIGYDYKIAPPLLKSEALANETLAKFTPFCKGARGTNFVIDDPAIVAALDHILEGRLVRFPAIPQPGLPGIRDLDGAIKKAERDITDELHNYIAEMDDTAFEWLLGALFLKLGYKKVRVTPQTGDHGVDVWATLVAGGVANIETGIQAKRLKRQSSVGSPDVMKLRGALSAHQAGVLITSGHFTGRAIEDAKASARTPITLISGEQLTQLLLHHEIGVEHVKKTLYRSRLGDLSREQLEARVEEFDEGDA